MYFIYDNYREKWYGKWFEKLEDAEAEMEQLIEDRRSRNLPYDFDIYEKIT